MTIPAYTVEQCDTVLESLYEAQVKLAGKVDSNISIGGVTFTRRNMQVLTSTIDYWQSQKAIALRNEGTGNRSSIPIRG